MYLLLPKVRLSLMTSDYFTNNVKNNRLVMCNNELEDTVKMTETLIGESMIFSSGINHPLARPWRAVGILLAIGGQRPSGFSDHIEAFDTRADLWVTVTKNEAARLSHHGSVFLNGSLYCVGGTNGDYDRKAIHRFDLGYRTWHEVSPVNSRRCFVSVTVLNGRIFAIGGLDGHYHFSTAECYDPETNQWAEIASMHEKRSDASCTTLDGNVYICGGFDGSQYLESAECYSQKTNQWTPMSSRRCGLGVIAYEGRVYAVGGFNAIHCMNTAEAYNSLIKSRHQVSSMQILRSNFGIEVVDGSSFVIGGFNDADH